MKAEKYLRPLNSRVRLVGLIIGVTIHVLFINTYIRYYENMTLLVFSFSIFFPIFAIYIYSKLVLATVYKARVNEDEEIEKQIEDATVSLVIPFYNEELEFIEAQVESILKQKKQFTNVYYIDDGSKSSAVSDFLTIVSREVPFINLHISEKNIGKREAQGLILPSITTEYIMTSDSDTILEEDCLYELLVPFYSKKESENIVSVTGKVMSSNEDSNFLTRVLNMRYFNAFESERAAQSATNSVIVASGPCTIYKTEIILNNLDDYLNQYFLNKKQTFGDDRCLTNISLKYGDVLYQSSAVVKTNVPTTMKSFIKQQIRWNRSFFRESILGIKGMVKHKHIKPLLWIILEVLMFVLMITTISIAFYSMIFEEGYLFLEFSMFFMFLIVNSIVRNIYYFSVTPKTIYLAPIYGTIHLFIIMPVKVYALFTIKDMRWITR